MYISDEVIHGFLVYGWIPAPNRRSSHRESALLPEEVISDVWYSAAFLKLNELRSFLASHTN